MQVTITIEEIGTKKCTRCGKEKPTAAFPPDKKGLGGRRSICRDCHNEQRRRHRMFVKYYKRGHATPMMTDELFSTVYRDPELKLYIKQLASRRSKGNDALESDMIEAAWIRIAFLRDGADLDCLKDTARKAIDNVKRKHWANWYHDGLTYQELLSSEEWAMWATGYIE